MKHSKKRKSSGRCSALDGHGKRCERQGEGLFSYHGDGEIYGWSDSSEPSWVIVSLCVMHKPKDKETHLASTRRMKREQREAANGK